MKSRFIVLISIFFLSLFACAEKNEENFLEGLLYIDNNPVRIEILDGKISKIKNIPPGADLPELYVAPGLIDMQINGYMGVDFATHDLQ